MNRPPVDSATVASDALAALRSAAARPATPAQAASSEVEATLAFRPATETAARVLNQLDGLTSSLEKAAAAHPATPQHPAEEECLESYLKRYMQQLTGKNPDPAATTAVSASNKAPEPSPTEPKQPPRQPAQAPEDRLRITAMRELANDSARRAMAASNNTLLVVKTRSSYLTTKILSLGSITLSVCYFATHSTIALAAATVVFGAALLCACRFALFCRKMGRTADLTAE